MEELVASSLEDLSNNTGDFWAQTVPVLEDPSQLRFAIDAYATYHPVIVTGIIDHWPALSKWDKNYLANAVRSKVGINLTPDGHGDCIKTVGNRKQFVYPAEISANMSTFFHLLENMQPEAVVPYLSQQNDNLRTDMECLLKDIDPTLPLVDEIFGGCAPEAVNVWIGDERSVSSIHKDHYENMYAVVHGEKTFTLFPPTDIAFFPEDIFPTSRYELSEEAKKMLTEFEDDPDPFHGVASQPSSSSPSCRNNTGAGLTLTGADLSLVRAGDEDGSSGRLSWLPFDPEDARENLLTGHPPLRLSHPLRVRVRAGQVLYIPAMWYHRVSQSQFTIAVNYWYDQRFDHRYDCVCLGRSFHCPVKLLPTCFCFAYSRYVFAQLAKSLHVNAKANSEEDGTVIVDI